MTISLSIPGEAEHLAVMRATVASIAARSHLTLDQIDDMRLAVEEAASLLLEGRPETVDLSIDPTALPLEIVISARTEQPISLEQDSFSWTILSAMTEHLDLTAEGGTTTLRLQFTGPVLPR